MLLSLLFSLPFCLPSFLSVSACLYLLNTQFQPHGDKLFSQLTCARGHAHTASIARNLV
ncbi:hypothetical protein GQ42DRAFT_161078 [Ramicandelaber brevisporus]|nr:hypothetical protein GQ42DRAFT_164005 [Ramicandelaber brevisporus]KAI8872727.1 hypothetical protein GQ42DRAFT_161078 [Ramicandelaber brevisporus]